MINTQIKQLATRALRNSQIKLLQFTFLTLLILFSGLFLQDIFATESSTGSSTASGSTFSDDDFFEEDDPFLDVDDAFAISADALDDEFIVRWKIAEGYYLYKHRFAFSAEGANLGPAIIPDGKKKVDEYFGAVEVYYKHIEISIPFTTSSDDIILTLKYQGCADAGLCYTPTTRKLTYKKQLDGQLMLVSGAEVKIQGVQNTSTEEQPKSESSVNTVVDNTLNNEDDSSFVGQSDSLLSVLSEGDILWTLLKFLGAGLLLTFTPCVLPMIPILSSAIAGQGDTITTGKAFRLSFVYVQAMAITYALLGVLVASAGSSLSGYLQSPWILGMAASIFILLSFSMFGFYEIKLPEFLHHRVHKVSQNTQGGSYFGVAIMGVISTLIVSPCTSAPLTAALLFIAQSGDQLVGGLSLYFLGLGMGIPLLLIGVSEGRLLPKAGAWMDLVKSLFGFMMLGMAIYITDHLMPGSLSLFLWGILLIAAASQFGAFSEAKTKQLALQKSMSLILLLMGVIYILGAAMGNERPLKPLANLQSSSATTTTGHSLDFTRFKSLADLNVHLKNASKSGQPVMVDFFADWCVACIEFEDYTFSSEEVQNLFKSKNVLLLQADVTANSEVDILLMQEFKILGLPSILFFDGNGVEQTRLRATGFEDSETFIKRLKKVYQ